MIGIYALLAEWQALADPATETGVAHLKLTWWRDEMQRLAQGSGAHPISSYLRALPRSADVDWSPLLQAVEAAAAQIGGAPWECRADLEGQSQALWGGPIELASRLAGEPLDPEGLGRSIRALAAAEYLAKALGDYRRDARRGRVSLALDDMLAAGITNGELAADVAPVSLQVYLATQRACAAGYFEAAGAALPALERPGQRHLLILAALGRRRLDAGPHSRARRVSDMLLAWTTARRAAARRGPSTSEIAR